ncbi:MAG: hypothetical protein AAGE52_11020 [Myxococcota bacterium]
MEPVEPEHEAEFREGFARYEAMIRERQPDLNENFFNLVRFGRHNGGLGSSLDFKLLIRVQGETDSPNDDVILEAKEVRDMSGVSCVRRGFGAFSILVSQSNIGRQDPRFLAQVPRDPSEAVDDRPFWVHEWVADYHELTLSDLRSPSDLEGIAYDVGVQLGQGHIRGTAETLHEQLRVEQRRMVDELNREMRRAIDDLSRLVIRSWEHYREE